MGRKLKIKNLTDNPAPKYAHDGDAGLDLRAAEDYVIPPRSIKAVRTGICVEIPDGCVGLQFSRSGHGLKGINLANSVGVIDSGFRGEILAEIMNNTDDVFRIEKGDRICQMVIMPYIPCVVEEVSDLSDSERGTNGYGSSGVK